MTGKTPRTKDLRGLPAADLQGQLTTLREELWQHRLKAKGGSLPRHHRIPTTRRQIARVFTVLNQQRTSTSKP